MASAALQLATEEPAHPRLDALVARARYFRTSGALAEAVRDGREAVAECPNDTGAVLELGASARARSDAAAEFQVYDQSLDSDPQNLPVTRVYVDRAIAERDFQRAVAVARRFTRAAPAVVPGWILLYGACRSQSDAACSASAQQGLDRARKSLELDPRPGARDANKSLARLVR